METLAAYEVFKTGAISSTAFISGLDLCKFYSRPVDVKAKPGDILEVEYESESDEPASPIKEKNERKISLVDEKERTSVTVATQTDYRESEAQTDPWDPPFVVKKVFKEPEILRLKDLSYGDGLPVSQREIEYIVESRQNEYQDVSTECNVDYDAFIKKKHQVCSQIRNEFNYKLSKQSERLLDKLKQMETALAKELTVKSERQERLLKNLWTQKKEQMVKTNSKLQKELKKEIKYLERKTGSGTQKFDPKTYGINQTSKELAHHVNKSKESLNRDIDYLISKYHMNPHGLSKLTDWLERKRTLLYNEIPLAKPARRTRAENLTEKAYQDLLAKKHTKLPPKLYREDYDKDESEPSSVRGEVEFEVLELPEDRVDLVTVWQQTLRGRAHQKQMLDLMDKHKDTLDVLLSSH